jgi:thioredoxin-related protein
MSRSYFQHLDEAAPLLCAHKVMKLKTTLLLAFAGSILIVGILAVGSTLPTSEYHPTNQDTWEQNLESGLERAASTGQPVLVYVWSPECSHCEEFAERMASNQELQATIDAFVPVAQTWENAQRVRAKYPIRGTPTFVVLTPNGEEVTTFVPTSVEDPTAVLETASENATAMS